MFREQAQFDQRVKRLNKKHDALARGYLMNVRSDGLIVTKPRRSRARISVLPVLFFIAAFVAFKGLMIASVGTETYSERVQLLQDGTVFEQGGAWIMQIDPVSEEIAAQIRPYLT